MVHEESEAKKAAEVGSEKGRVISQKKIIASLAQWFGLGLLPRSPGTFGTLGAIPLVYALVITGEIPYLILTLAFIVFAIWVAHVHESSLRSHDASEIVIDEVAGFLVSMAWVPFEWKWVGLAFVLFRFFDILKPFPINYLDKNVKGGLGTVVDDVAAGLVVNVILQTLLGRWHWIG